MTQMAQHAAAELWELTRDHFVCAAKLEMVEPTISDPQLRSMIHNHARECRQAAERLEQFMRDSSRSGHSFTPPSSFGGSFTSHSQFGSGFHNNHGNSHGGSNPTDVIISSSCLSECKNLAVKSIWGATESSQPVRSFLHELAGRHLRMAEEHYHWLEQRNMYASPKVDMQSINEYEQKLRQFEQFGNRHIQTGQMNMNPMLHNSSYLSSQSNPNFNTTWQHAQQHTPSYHSYSQR